MFILGCHLSSLKGFLAMGNRIINHPLFLHVAFYLETPADGPGYEVEIRMLKQYRNVENLC